MFSVVLFVIAIICFTLEILTVSTFFVWIGIAFLVASILSLFITNVVIITGVGILVAVFSLLFFRTKYVSMISKTPDVKTAYEEMIGQFVIISTDLSEENQYIGLAKYKTETWSVTSKVPFKKGEKAKIKEIIGVKLIIEKIEE